MNVNAFLQNHQRTIQYSGRPFFWKEKSQNVKNRGQNPKLYDYTGFNPGAISMNLSVEKDLGRSMGNPRALAISRAFHANWGEREREGRGESEGEYRSQMS